MSVRIETGWQGVAPVARQVVGRSDGMEQSKAEPCIFRKMINGKVTLMVGVHVDDIIVSGEKDVCDEFFRRFKK